MWLVAWGVWCVGCGRGCVCVCVRVAVGVAVAVAVAEVSNITFKSFSRTSIKCVFRHLKCAFRRIHKVRMFSKSKSSFPISVLRVWPEPCPWEFLDLMSKSTFSNSKSMFSICSHMLAQSTRFNFLASCKPNDAFMFVVTALVVCTICSKKFKSKQGLNGLFTY